MSQLKLLSGTGTNLARLVRQSRPLHGSVVESFADDMGVLGEFVLQPLSQLFCFFTQLRDGLSVLFHGILRRLEVSLAVTLCRIEQLFWNLVSGIFI